MLQTFADIDYVVNYIGLKLLQLLQDLILFLSFAFCPLDFLCNQIIVSGVCNSSLYLTFILRTNLLLILLM